jgi:hypothetical protein
VSLNGEIGEFGSLVGLLLALDALLTANRSSALDRLRASATPTEQRATYETALSAALAVVTALVFLSGLPLWIRAVEDLHPLAHGGALRSVFVLSWLLLVPLVLWQANLARAGWRLRARIHAQRPSGEINAR